MRTSETLGPSGAPIGHPTDRPPWDQLLHVGSVQNSPWRTAGPTSLWAGCSAEEALCRARARQRRREARRARPADTEDRGSQLDGLVDLLRRSRRRDRETQNASHGVRGQDGSPVSRQPWRASVAANVSHGLTGITRVGSRRVRASQGTFSFVPPMRS